MSRSHRLLLTFLVTLITCGLVAVVSATPSEATRVNAHQGVHHNTARGPSPDSLDAQREAYRLGVCAESDVRLTEDLDPRHAVNLHDSRLDTRTDGEGLVEESSFTYVRSLHLQDGQQVPTLLESMKLAARKHGCLFMEFKSLLWSGDMLAWVQRKAKHLGIIKRFHPYLAWSPLVERARDFAPDLRSIWKMKTETDLQRIKDYELWGVCPRWGGIYKNNILRLHRLGVKVQAPLSGPDRWAKIKRLQVDYVITNNPFKAARYFG